MNTARQAKAFSVWRLLRDARQAAGLTQRRVAERAGTSQAAVARYEAARALPDLDTLQRLLLACGRRLTVSAEELDEQELRQLRESVQLSPQRRLRRNHSMTRLAAKAAQARREGRVRPLSDA